MLKEIIDLQKNAVTQLIEILNKKDKLTFKAPTGSGKTYMMADFMNQILSEKSDVIFLVSTLSKGNLAAQNYEKFIQYSTSGQFQNIKPYLINSEISGEESLFIPIDYNVYVLPRDLYKKNSRLMSGPMENFLNAETFNNFLGGQEKEIYLIKDECHKATNNLDNISDNYFTKIINFSATPNPKNGQSPDVEIREEDAINAKLIKKVDYGREEETLDVALDKFMEIKQQYIDLLGVNPCLIIQISNKDKADIELKNTIFPALEKYPNLKWMLIVDDTGNKKGSDTNDKIRNLPVSRWRDYAKENTSTIDVIIFKMVISEGWDIPRACMLYQVRKTQSDTLDEQVMGRVRRNPRLLDFENLSQEAKNLATTAWIWATPKETTHKTYAVKLFDEPSDITNNLKIRTTKLKTLDKKFDFELNKFVDNLKDHNKYNIFALYHKLNKSDDSIKAMCYEYSDTIEKWFKFTDNLDVITKESEKCICDYDQSMELVKDEKGSPLISSLPESSFYIDNGNPINVNDWVWQKQKSKEEFSCDSYAEWKWANLLKDLSSMDYIKAVICGKDNPCAGNKDLFGNIQPKKLNEEKKFVWGKNFVSNSNIKYEYYLDGIHSSYPDFVMVDKQDRVHIFEVKSINKSRDFNFDSNEYDAKIDELKKCYKKASELTNHIFYLPILKDDDWDIIWYMNGEEQNRLREGTFKEFLKTPSK